MGKRLTKEESAAVDTQLRRVSRRFPEALLRLFNIQGKAQISGWVETQVAARQRRADRALAVVIDGREQQLHVEWTDRWTRDVKERVSDYNHLLSEGARIDNHAKRKRERGTQPPPPVDSAVVILSGRKAKWPAYAQHRTSSDNAEFSGVHVRIEAIYQKTVAEMEAMGSVFWLVFVPVAIDVDEEKLIQVIDRLKRSTNEEEYGDLLAAMLEIARTKKDRPELANVILSHGKRDAIMFGSVWEEARLEGKRQGKLEGKLEGKREGKLKGKLELLLAQFERRLGRPLTAGERHRVGSRLTKLGATVVGNVVCDLSRKQIVAWLAPNGHRST